MSTVTRIDVSNKVVEVSSSGPQGLLGPQGDPNTLTVDSVTTSAPGSPAEVTISGEAPAQTISFVIPRGERGPEGALAEPPFLWTVPEPTDIPVRIRAAENQTANLIEWQNSETSVLTHIDKDGVIYAPEISVSGPLDLQQIELKADLKNVSAVTPLLIDSFLSTAYRGAEYTVQITQSNNYFITKLLLIHNGSDVAITEFGTTALGEDIEYTFSTNFSVGVLELLITCPTANMNSVSIKLYRVLHDI